MKIFLSAVSGQFKACRDALRSDLSAVGAHVKVQEDFQQHGGSLLEKLERYIASCDRVIALVGDVYGFEPDEVARPAFQPRRSYTQWEYFFAAGERLSGRLQPAKDIFLYFASPEFLALHPVAQADDVARVQHEFSEALTRSGKDWNRFGTLHELRALVLRDGFRLQERPPQIRSLPFASLGRLFKGRGGVLSQLQDALRDDPGRPLIIQGSAGIGKTRLTIEYALRNEADYTALLSVGANTPEELKRNLASLCDTPVLNLPERDAKEQEVKLTATVRWLSEHAGWLLILDNADTREAADTVEELLPRLRGGHVMITSRLSDWSGSVAPFELELLRESDAEEFLLERTRNRRLETANDPDKAHELAHELDRLPLTLEQAGAFISQMRCSIEQYLARWRAHEEKVRKWHDARLMHYPLSAAVTWDTTFEHLKGGAWVLLSLLCWLAAEAIPPELIAPVKLQRKKQGAADDAPAEDLPLEDALAELAGFSVIKWETGNRTFRLHRLVQEAVRERVPNEQRPAALQGMLWLVNNYIPGEPSPSDVRSWPLWQTMTSHVAELIVLAIDARIGEPTSRLASMLGMYLSACGLSSDAEPLARIALQIDESMLGPDDPTVAIRLNNLAEILKEMQQYDEAEPLLRRALEIEEESFGSEHANVAVRLHNLASLLISIGRLEEADPLARRALAIDEEHLGPDHRDIARDLNLLAGLLVYTSRLPEAEPLLRRALAIDEAAFAPDHPNIARDLHNLANVIWDTDPKEAVVLLRRALLINEQNYGPDHPHAAVIRRSLEQLPSIERPRKRRAPRQR